MNAPIGNPPVNEVPNVLPPDIVIAITRNVLNERADSMVWTHQTILFDHYGIHNAPIKSIDWHPRFPNLNCFYVAADDVLGFPQEAYTMLWYLSRVGKIGFILDKEWMMTSINMWIANPLSVSYFSDWLLKFAGYAEWLQVLQVTLELPFGFFVFEIEETLEMREDGLHVLDRYLFRLESIHALNPMQDPIRNRHAWMEVKSRLVELNNYPIIDVPAGLLDPHNYHFDGRVRHHISVLPMETIVAQRFAMSRYYGAPMIIGPLYGGNIQQPNGPNYGEGDLQAENGLGVQEQEIEAGYLLEEGSESEVSLDESINDEPFEDEGNGIEQPMAVVPDLNLNPVDYPMEQVELDQVVPNLGIAQENQQQNGIELSVKIDVAGPSSVAAEILPE